jgi:predicted nucleotidyltransferase
MRHLTREREYTTLVPMELDPTALAEVCVRNGIVRLRVFGSVARGEETADSDLDLLVDFASRKTLLDLVRIEREFSERLGLRVDLLTEPSLHPKLRDRILGDARVIYERAA